MAGIPPQPNNALQVRVLFVQGMNKPLIDQLLDDLLADGVLNAGEKDWVLEENRSTADRARCLFDMVKKKGDLAMNRMDVHLMARDPVLYDSLVRARGNNEMVIDPPPYTK